MKLLTATALSLLLIGLSQKQVMASSLYFTAPGWVYGLSENNIGKYNAAQENIYTCISPYTDNVLTPISGQTEFAIAFEIVSLSEAVIGITDTGVFNLDNQTGADGEKLSCSGKYETTTQMYEDIILVGSSPMSVAFSLLDADVFTFKLASAETLPQKLAALTYYGPGSYLDDSHFPKTDKYKIADYGFFQITTVGRHDGMSRNPQEVQDAGPFLTAGVVHRADLNGDGHEDFYYEGAFEGDREFTPNQYLNAFINDGNGHFVNSPDIFAGGTSPCINYGDLDFKTDPYNDCGYVRHLQRGLVGDFNGDGIDDFFKPSILHLSNDGVIENKGRTNLPSWMFAIDDDPNSKNGAYSHDVVAGDIDNDGDLDIFGAWSHNADDYEPGDYHCQCGPGVMINDGTGNFTTTNWNFYQMPLPYEIPGGADHILWNTTAAIGDFDSDSFGDVSVGWANPNQAKIYGFGDEYEFSAGAVFWNDENMDWSKQWTELPNNYYGVNGLANDMETIDFNNDGYLDIVLASTKVDPYYDGRAVQFFLNNGDGTFSDVTSTYNPDIGKYANGNGASWWNGEGSLHILDFDNDGDLDIVDSVHGTYVLINEVGTFSIYDNFPDQGKCGGCRYYPVEIDGKWQYDFIGYTDERTYDSQIAKFFQVLDPPLIPEPAQRLNHSQAPQR
tara:strand:- start:1190 stop:3202 length:2013 start_codon:yes stop_codon:yes gene_type:complete